MSTPVLKFSVVTFSGDAAVVVEAQTFTVTPNGDIVFYSGTNQTVAAFAAKDWQSVIPAVSS